MRGPPPDESPVRRLGMRAAGEDGRVSGCGGGVAESLGGGRPRDTHTFARLSGGDGLVGAANRATGRGRNVC